MASKKAARPESSVSSKAWKLAGVPWKAKFPTIGKGRGLNHRRGSVAAGDELTVGVHIEHDRGSGGNAVRRNFAERWLHLEDDPDVGRTSDKTVRRGFFRKRQRLLSAEIVALRLQQVSGKPFRAIPQGAPRARALLEEVWINKPDAA